MAGAASSVWGHNAHEAMQLLSMLMGPLPRHTHIHHTHGLPDPWTVHGWSWLRVKKTLRWPADPGEHMHRRHSAGHTDHPTEKSATGLFDRINQRLKH